MSRPRYTVSVKFPDRNTPKLLLIATLQGLTFYTAFEKIFFQENGLSIIEISLLTIVFSITLITLEIPSGALSDRWVRTHVLSLSIVASIITLLLFATGDTFLQFGLGMFFAGVAFVLNSGTNTSLLFDSLKEAGATNSFEKYLAARRILFGAGFAIASLVGGWIANTYGIATTMWVTLLALIPALVLCMSLREPHFHKTTGELSYWKHIKYTATHLSGQRYFVQVAALSVVIMTVNILIEDYVQLYYYFAGFSLFAIGILSFFEGVKEMVGNYVGARIVQTRRTAYTYGYLLVFMCGALLLTAWQVNIVGVLGLFIASIIFFIIDVPLLGSFHKKLDSKIRATSESFLNLVTELTKVLLALGFAFIANEYSINIAFGALGLLVLFYTIYYFAFSLKIIRDTI